MALADKRSQCLALRQAAGREPQTPLRVVVGEADEAAGPFVDLHLRRPPAGEVGAGRDGPIDSRRRRVNVHGVEDLLHDVWMILPIG